MLFVLKCLFLDLIKMSTIKKNMSDSQMTITSCILERVLLKKRLECVKLSELANLYSWKSSRHTF